MSNKQHGSKHHESRDSRYDPYPKDDRGRKSQDVRNIKPDAHGYYGYLGSHSSPVSTQSVSSNQSSSTYQPRLSSGPSYRGPVEQPRYSSGPVYQSPLDPSAATGEPELVLNPITVNPVAPQQPPVPIFGAEKPQVGSAEYEYIKQMGFDVDWLYGDDRVPQPDFPPSWRKEIYANPAIRRLISYYYKNMPMPSVPRYLDPGQVIVVDPTSPCYSSPVQGTALPDDWKVEKAFNYLLPLVPGTNVVANAPLIKSLSPHIPASITYAFGCYYLNVKISGWSRPYALRHTMDSDVKAEVLENEPVQPETALFIVDNRFPRAVPNDATAPGRI